MNESLPGKDRPRAKRARVIGVFFAAWASLFALDALLFRTGLYPAVAEPDSTMGRFELALRRAQQDQQTFPDNLIVTLGDSRFGYLPHRANALTPQSGYSFSHAGVPGTNPRAWYYMLRDLDPTCRRYRAIVIAVNDYDDEDLGFDPEQDLTPLHYIAGRLRLSDIPDAVMAEKTAALRWSSFRDSLFKGFVYQQDLHALLAHPIDRLSKVVLFRRDWASWTDTYDPPETSMVGLQIDWQRWTAQLPPNPNQGQIESVRDILMRKPVPQTGDAARFRRHWFGRILDRYQGSRTRIVFLRLGRGPIPRPAGLVRKLSSSIRDFGRRPNVILLPEHAFEFLERPENYLDGTHLNRAGAHLFTPQMVEELRRALGPIEENSL